MGSRIISLFHTLYHQISADSRCLDLPPSSEYGMAVRNLAGLWRRQRLSPDPCYDSVRVPNPCTSPLILHLGTSTMVSEI